MGRDREDSVGLTPAEIEELRAAARREQRILALEERAVTLSPTGRKLMWAMLVSVVLGIPSLHLRLGETISETRSVAERIARIEMLAFMSAGGRFSAADGRILVRCVRLRFTELLAATLPDTAELTVEETRRCLEALQALEDDLAKR